MKSNSVFNLLIIIISLGVLAYFVMQLLNPKTDNDQDKSVSNKPESQEEQSLQQKESEIVVRAPTTTKKTVTFAEPVVTESKSNPNEQVVDYEPVVIRQEFPVTPLSFPGSPQQGQIPGQIPTQLQQPMQLPNMPVQPQSQMMQTPMQPIQPMHNQMQGQVTQQRQHGLQNQQMKPMYI